jgi:cytochrome c peroxidase
LRLAVLGAAVLGAALSSSSLGGISRADSLPFYANPFDKQPDAAALTALGRELFSDPALSAAGKISCATCHDPGHSFGPPQGLKLGVRAVPSLMYAQNTPPFTEHFIDDEGDDSVDLGPAGGRTWDGRAQSLHEQARLPLFAPLEMANRDADAVVVRVQARYAAAFRRVFGEKIFDDKTLAFKGVLMALEAYQLSPAEFYPYSSKYDAYLRHEAALNAQELKGLAAFNDPAKGNCARCHPSALRQGAFPQFTDFGFAAIGVPRNPGIPANADRRYHDLGLCGPLRADLKGRSEYCGMFRTPTLRNAATRRVFFHNGVLHTLSDAVRFYAERDTKPASWYPRAGDGSVFKFDDLPPEYRANLDTKVPFDLQAGDAPALSEEDIADIVAFLETLTDGYR